MENLVNLEVLSSFYRGKKVFVTGHTGFKGSWLTSCLHLMGATVKGYALAPESADSLYNIIGSKCDIESIISDIRDAKRLHKEIISFQPDYIFHLAAQPLVRRSYKIPAETFDVNVVGTANLLEAVNLLPSSCAVVVITTDKVYENKETNVLYKETDPLGGYDPYSSSKACAEFVTSSFRNSFFNLSDWQTHKKAVATARAGNVIGGGDWNPDRIIPDIVRSLSKNQTIEIRNPNAIRPWQHVLESIGGYLLLGGKLYEDPLRFSRALNFGPLPEDHLTVKQVVEMAIQRWGSGDWMSKENPGAPHEAGLLKLDITEAEKGLGWRPKLNANLAIRWTIDWYRQPLTKANEFTFKQIADYFLL